MNIYQEEILEHYRHPHNTGQLEHADVVQQEYNPFCGDKLTLYLTFVDNKVAEVRFMGEGCAISQAATSMLTDKIAGMTRKQIQQLTKEDVLQLLGIELGPTRLKCALLSLQGIHHAIQQAPTPTSKDVTA
ncbi:MAG: SUF system NifU family Fe-S cluster assembly protein [Candidatus Kerfeldbacteria bacterium]|nr:SUF system NifU family Fe-S cluster assembly protein [Candidatus Kerfeldbacteria bacterium]